LYISEAYSRDDGRRGKSHVWVLHTTVWETGWEDEDVVRGPWVFEDDRLLLLASERLWQRC
jgi:hypothetical protein